MQRLPGEERGRKRRTDGSLRRARPPSRGNKEPKSFPSSSFKLTWDLPLHPRSHKYLNLMNFTAGVDSNQSFFHGIPPLCIIRLMLIGNHPEFRSVLLFFETSCSSNSRIISNHFALGIIFFQFSKPLPSLVSSVSCQLPTSLFFFSLSCYFLDIEYRVSIWKKKKKKEK